MALAVSSPLAGSLSRQIASNEDQKFDAGTQGVGPTGIYVRVSQPVARARHGHNIGYLSW